MGSVSAPPLERLRRRWREEGLRGARDLLARHSRRLSPLENEAYGKRLARFASPEEPGDENGVDARGAKPSAGPRFESGIPTDAAWMEFRRRLYRRILQSQKAALGLGTVLPREPVGDGAGPQRLVGPYNDLHNLEGLLDFIAGMDPAWVEEFSSHYRDLSRLRVLLAGPGRTGPR